MIDFQQCPDFASSSFFLSSLASLYGPARTDIEISVLAKYFWEIPEKNQFEKILRQLKDVKELSWMSQRVIRFWFLLNFLLWYSSFIINFPRFFKRLFSPTKILLLRHSQNNYQMWLYKLNLMCEGLSYQIINTSVVNQAVFCYY